MAAGEPRDQRPDPADALQHHPSSSATLMTGHSMSSTRSGENGVALVFTLFLMAALSAMAVSLMFLAQTETSASRNYRTMSQARYAGEAGIHKALNYMLYSYTTPSGTGSDQLSSYDITHATTCADTTIPTCVLYSGNPVVLSSSGSVAANYPDAT